MKSFVKRVAGGGRGGFYRAVAAVAILVMLVMTVGSVVAATPAAAASPVVVDATGAAASSVSPDAAPVAAAPAETSAEAATPEAIAPAEAVPDGAAPDEAAFDEISPGGVSADEVSTEDDAPVAPDESGEILPDESVSVAPAETTTAAVTPAETTPAAISPGALTPTALRTYTAESADGSVRAEFTTAEGITDPYLVVNPLTQSETDSFRSELTSGQTGFALGSVELFDSSGTRLYVSDITLSFDLSKFLPGAVPVYSGTATSGADDSEAAPDSDDEDEDYDDDDYYDDEDEDDDEGYSDEEDWDDEFYETYDENDIKTFDPADYPAVFKEKIPAKVYYAKTSGTEQAEPEIEYDEVRDVYTIDGNEYVRDEVTGGYRWYDEDEGEYDYYYPDGGDDDYSVTLGGRDGFEGADGSRYVYDPATDSYATADGTGRFTYDADEGVYYSDDEDYFYYYDGSYAYSADEDADDPDADEDTDTEEDADTEDTDADADADEDAGEDDDADTDDADTDADTDDDDGYVWHGIEEYDGWPGWYYNYDDPGEIYVDKAIVDEARDFKDKYEFGYGKYFEGYHHDRYVFNGHYYTYDKATCTYVWDKSYEKAHGKPIVNAFTDHIFWDPGAKKYYETWYDEYNADEFDGDDEDGTYRYDRNYRGYSFAYYWFRHTENGDYPFDRKLNTYGLYDGERYCWQDGDSGYDDGFYFNKDGGRVDSEVDTDDYYGGSVSHFAVDSSARVYERPSAAAASYSTYNYGDGYDDGDDYYDYRARGAAPGAGVQSGMNTFRIIDIVTAGGVRWAQIDAMVRVPYSDKRLAGDERAGDNSDNKNGYVIDFYGYMPADKLEPGILGNYDVNNIASLADGAAATGGGIAPDASPGTAAGILDTAIDGYTATTTVAALSAFMLKHSYDTIGYEEMPPLAAPTAPVDSSAGGKAKNSSHARPTARGAEGKAAAERTELSGNQIDTLYGRGVLGKVNKPAAEERKTRAGGPEEDGYIGATVAGFPLAAIVLAIAAAAIATILLLRRRYKSHR